MPIYSATVTGPAQFDGLTAATGLFDPAASTGDRAIQVRVNSLSFSGPATITSWSLNKIDPGDGQVILMLTAGTVDFTLEGGSVIVLPTNSDGEPWRLSFVTTVMTGTGILKIDYDFERTEG